jgi:hypothetical protein
MPRYSEAMAAFKRLLTASRSGADILCGDGRGLDRLRAIGRIGLGRGDAPEQYGSRYESLSDQRERILELLLEVHRLRFRSRFFQHSQAGGWNEPLQRRFAATPRFKTSNASDAPEFLNRS